MPIVKMNGCLVLQKCQERGKTSSEGFAVGRRARKVKDEAEKQRDDRLAVALQEG